MTEKLKQFGVINSVILVLLLVLNFSTTTLEAQNMFSDFAKTKGLWKGKLTYVDYTTGKPYTMNANITIEANESKTIIYVHNEYPQESNANSTDTVIFANQRIGKEKVISRNKSKTGTVTIVTEEEGTDGNDNKAALFRFTYVISPKEFSKKKEVKFQGANNWIERHSYVYLRD